MNGLDWALVALVGLSTVLAAMQGFFYEIWMMTAAVGGVMLAAWRYSQVADWMLRVAPALSPAARDFLAFAAILAVVLLTAAAVGRLARGVVRAMGLGWFDRGLGAALGLVRGVVLGAALLLMLAPAWPALLQGSAFAPDVLWAGHAVSLLMPRSLSERFPTAPLTRELP